MHLLQETPGKAAICACLAFNSNTCWKVSPGPSLPVMKKQIFCSSSPGERLVGPGQKRGRRRGSEAASHSVSLLIPTLSSDPVPVMLFTAVNRTKITSLFYPGLQTLVTLTGEGWEVFFLSSCTFLTKVLTEAEQPPEYAAETFIELKWK